MWGMWSCNNMFDSALDAASGCRYAKTMALGDDNLVVEVVDVVVVDAEPCGGDATPTIEEAQISMARIVAFSAYRAPNNTFDSALVPRSTEMEGSLEPKSRRSA